jgi:hypothetical protein
MREFSFALFPPSFLVQPIAVFFEWFFLKTTPRLVVKSGNFS